VFSVEGGWPYGEIKDSDPTLFDKEKRIGGPHPIRLANLLVTEMAKERGVTSFIVDIPQVCQ